MNKERVEKINSGLKVGGDWQQICDFSKDFEKVVRKRFDEKSANEYKEWRPREEENIDDVTNKTAKKASMKKSKYEEKYSEKQFEKSSKNILSNIASKAFRFLRKTEELIYSKIMLKFNNYYFNTSNLFISLKDDSDEKYEMTLNIPKDDLREEVQKEFNEVN